MSLTCTRPKAAYHGWRFYWINLLHRSDRRKRMMDQFARLGITNHVRIDGVYAATPAGEVPTYAGCIQSHLRAVTAASLDGMDADDAVAVFLEDDIVLTEASLQALQTCLAALPPDWEVFQAHVIIPSLYEAVLQKIEKTGIRPPNHLLRGFFMSAAAYVMCARGIHRFMTSRLRPPAHLVSPTFDFVVDGRPVIPELVVYQAMNVYTTLYSVTNTDETVPADNDHMEATKRQPLINYRNMLLVDRIFKSGVEVGRLANRIIDIPPLCHWFDCAATASCFLDPIWSSSIHVDSDKT
ncbi:hypothetical protein EBZ80_22790 [bacterium]|nr:hypothetical protein [bacterium]